MLNKQLICSFIKTYTGLPQDRFELELLDSPEKDVARAYLWPRRFLDGDLQREIEKFRDRSNMADVSRVPEVKELCVLMEAYRSPQYNKLIKDLIRYFTNTVTSTHVFPVASITEKDTKCEICGKQILYFDEWKESRDQLEKLGIDALGLLAYGNPGTSMCLCLNCLIQLNYLIDLL